MIAADLVIDINMFDITQVVPQVWATIWATLIIIGLSIFTYFYYKKWDAKKKPGAIQSVVESSFEGIENSFEEMAGPRLKKAYPYFFTLGIYIFVCATMELLGFNNPAGSIAFTFALALITFIGIFVVGIATQGLIHFVTHKYKNPLELISQFSPLISLTIRLFGAVFAGSILGALLMIIITSMSDSAPLLAALPFINIAWTWMMSGITIFFGGIQAMVFVSLTMIYWNLELGDKKERKEAKRKAKLEKKEAKHASAIVADGSVDSKSKSSSLTSIFKKKNKVELKEETLVEKI